MTTQLALHAYIFLGNALNYLANTAPPEQLAGLNATHAELLDLYRAVEPLTPNGILDALHNLPPAQHNLLLRCCRWCLTHLDPQFDTLMGISDEEAAEVLAHLSHHEIQ